MDYKKDGSFLSVSSDEEKSNEDIKEENNNIIQKNENNKTEGTQKISDKDYIIKLREKLNNNTTKIRNKKILILPSPLNDLVDKHFNTKDIIEEDDLEQKGFIKLMNPDNLNIKINNDNINNDDINNEKNVISINQKDILDKNWEIKYINNIFKKDMKEALKNEEDKDDKNKNNKINNKQRKRDKKDNIEDELVENNIRSKYDKISTKKKYGW